MAIDDEMLEMNLRAAQFKWWAPVVWRLGAIALWLFRLRKLNGPKFTWPLLLFSSALPENLMARMGKIYPGKPLKIKSRKELLATIRPQFWKYLRQIRETCPTLWLQPRTARLLRLEGN